ncbi:hypothetical protein M569_07873, partial [Genlisea aurea]
MGRWRTPVILDHILRASKSIGNLNSSRNACPKSLFASIVLQPRIFLSNLRWFSALPSPSPCYVEDNEFKVDSLSKSRISDDEAVKSDSETVTIPVKAFFVCTSVDLKSLQAENSSYVIPQAGRSSNSIALRFRRPLFGQVIHSFQVVAGGVSCHRYMLVFQYGSAVLFNIQDQEVDHYLQTVKRHGSGLLSDIRKDDYAIKEMALLEEDMKGGPDHIILKTLDMDSIRIIGRVLGQSIALDHFVSQVDGMVEEFAEINRGMEKTGTFTMERKKLFQLVGKANSNIADVILKVGLFERSEIAWRDAKYAQILDYLREEYEVNQRFGDLDFKLKFVEHNIHFLQEVLQNRKSDLLEWCIIVLLTVENVISLYTIVKESVGPSM